MSNLIIETIDIELGHYYLADLLGITGDLDMRFIERGILRSKVHAQAGATIKYSVLLDDLGQNYSDEEKILGKNFIEKALKERNIEPVKIVFESQMNTWAQSLLDTIRENYLLDANDSIYLNISSQDPFLWASETLETPRSGKQIFMERLSGKLEAPSLPSQSQFLVPMYVKSNIYRPFGCSLLTAVWYLHRLGVKGFSSSAPNTNQKNISLLNILPIKYLKSEGFAIDILRLSSATRIKKATKRIEYIVI